MSNIHSKLEEIRIKRINKLEVLSLTPNVGFDNIAHLAAEIFDVENACISFIGNEVFTISRIGNVYLNDNLFQLCISELQTKEVFLQYDSTNKNINFLIAVPIKTLQNDIIGVISVYSGKDILVTDNEINILKKLPAILTEKLTTRLAIRNTMRAQDDRLHVLIHDLKNPMTTLSLQSELISRIPDIDEKAALIANKINLQAKKVVEHLNDILSSARKEKESFKPRKEKINLSTILKKVVHQIDYKSRKNNLQIHLEIDEILEIYGDEEKLEIVFNQILQNAIKFSEIAGEIRISQQKKENKIIIAIQDNGVGLSAEDLNNLFIKFANLSSKSTTREYSNGLGLTLAKMYIDMHKGNLWAESEGENKGTTFFVELPVK